MNVSHAKNLTKEELLFRIINGEPLALQLEKTVKKERKSVKVGWYVFFYPVIIGILLFLSVKAGYSLPYDQWTFYVAIVAGWLALVSLQIPLITYRINRQQKKQRLIEQEFIKVTGLHRKLCNSAKLTFMKQALETEGATSYQEALDSADRKYHGLLVQAEEDARPSTMAALAK